MIIFSHPTGNANVRHAACALQEAGLLDELWTCLAPEEKDLWLRMLPARHRARFMRRDLPSALRPYVRTRPWRELGRFAAGSMGWEFLTRHEVGPCSVDGVYRDLDKAVASRVRKKKASIGAVYAYEDGSLETFRAAIQNNLQRIYDLPIAYWKAGRQIFLEEAQRQPEWAATLDGLKDSQSKLDRKDEELRMADSVLVASSFTAKTLALAGEGPRRVHVIPYGAPRSLETSPPPRLETTAPLRVLFVGSLGQRKGIAYLLEARAALGPHVELTLIGNRGPGKCLPLDHGLKANRWIPSCSHTEVLEEMRNHDVFVFPSLFEGFGLVILEAMSQGMVVITTPNTGGPDILSDGIDGFIVPIRSSQAIQEKLEVLLKSRPLLRSMQQAAFRKASTLSWSTYRSGVAKAASEALACRD